MKSKQRHDGGSYRRMKTMIAYHAKAAKDQQIDTLKKALELACRNACDESKKPMSGWDMVGCPPHAGPDACNGGNNGMCHECWMRYFIHQAQEQEGKK